MSDEPLLYDLSARAIGLILQAYSMLRFRVTVRGFDNFTRSPSTLVVFNHSRDADIAISVSLLYGGREYFKARRLKANYVAREDMFRPGFLANYLTGWPRPFRVLLSHLNLRPVFAPLHAYPMRRVAERTLGEVLQDTLATFGDLPLDEVLKAEWVEEFAAAGPRGVRERKGLRVTDVLDERYRPLLATQHGLLRVTHAHFRKMRPYEEKVIESQLQKFIELLDQGELVQMAPEGVVSLEGRFAPIRAGLHVLLNRPRANVRVLPLGITYDPMDLGRTRAFVNLGEEILGLKGLNPEETSRRVSNAILSLSTVTLSHLVSRFLLDTRAAGRDVISMRELEATVVSQARRWAREGFYVDPRLRSPLARKRRIRGFLSWAERNGTLSSLSEDSYRLAALDGEGGWRGPSEAGKAVRFLANQLASIEEVLRPDLSPPLRALAVTEPSAAPRP